MDKFMAFLASAEKWVDDHPRQTLIYGSVAVLALAVLGAVIG